jgi:hypothetical protein
MRISRIQKARNYRIFRNFSWPADAWEPPSLVNERPPDPAMASSASGRKRTLIGRHLSQLSNVGSGILRRVLR